jgi:hypothetical protein
MTWAAPADTTGIADYIVSVQDAHTQAVTTFDTQSTNTSFTLSGLGYQQYFVTVTALDASGNPSQTSGAVSIYGAAVPPLTWSAAPTSAIVGNPVTVQFATSAGYTYSVVSGPAGAAIDSTGLLTFTPTQTGNNQVIVSAANPNSWGTVDAVLNIPVYLSDAPTGLAVASTTDPVSGNTIVTASWNPSTQNLAAVAGYQVEIIPTGSTTPTYTFVSGTSLVLSDLGVTTGSIQVTATDGLGNFGVASSWVTF